MTTTGPSTGELTPVRFARRSSRGFAFGMSKTRLATVGAAFVVVAVAMVSSQVFGVVATSPVWGTALLVAYMPSYGRKIIDWLPVVLHWSWRRAVGQHWFRARPLRPRPAGTLALPGDAARLRVVVDQVTGAALIHDPHLGTLTAVLRVRHGAFVLVDPATQSARADAWGRVLGGLATHHRGITRVQVLERALPDAGVDVTAWWVSNGHQDGSWMAQAYTELLAQATPAAERHETMIAITLSLSAAAGSIRERGGSLHGATVVMRERMRSFEAAIRSADLTPSGWLTDTGLAWVLRTTYDPRSAEKLDGKRVGGSLSTAGPIAVDEEWARMRSDSGWHTTLWISEWPRLEVVPGFLWPLVLGPPVRRSLSITAEPVPTATALKEVRSRSATP